MLVGKMVIEQVLDCEGLIGSSVINCRVCRCEW